MSFHYLATPYSKYAGGLDAAFRMACEASAKLTRAGVPFFCPIAHTHPIATMGGIDPLDHAIWLPADEPMMRAACGLLIFKAPGWRRSFGIAQEVKAFRAMKKPVRAITLASINDPGVHAVLRYAANGSHANARDEDVGCETKEPTLERASRLEPRRSGSATSETRDVTAGETAPTFNREDIEAACEQACCGRCRVIPCVCTDPPAEEFEIPAFLRRQKTAEAAQP